MLVQSPKGISVRLLPTPVGTASRADKSKKTTFAGFNKDIQLDPAENDDELQCAVADRVGLLKERATDSIAAAKKIQVSMAKKDFIFKMLSVAMSGMGLGLAVAATVLSGGMAVPLTALVGGAFLLAVADAGCAFRNWRNQASDDPGRTPMPMDNDAIANATYFLVNKMGASEDTAMLCARSVSLVSRFGLGIATLWVGFVNPALVAGTTNHLLGAISAGTSTTGETINTTNALLGSWLQIKQKKIERLKEQQDTIKEVASVTNGVNEWNGRVAAELAGDLSHNNNEFVPVSLSKRTVVRLLPTPVGAVGRADEPKKATIEQFNENIRLDPAENDDELQGTVADRINLLKEHAADSVAAAKKIRVSMAKKDFIFKMLSVAMSGMGLGLAVAATVLSGGMAVPLTALVGGAFLLSVADAGCAFRNWRNQASDDPGRTPMPMDNDAIANATYFLVNKMGASEDTAMLCARSVSLVSRFGLGIATLWVGFVNPALVAGTTSHLLGAISAGTSTTGETINTTNALLGSWLQIKQKEIEEQQQGMLKEAARITDEANKTMGRLADDLSRNNSELIPVY